MSLEVKCPKHVPAIAACIFDSMKQVVCTAPIYRSIYAHSFIRPFFLFAISLSIFEYHQQFCYSSCYWGCPSLLLFCGIHLDVRVSIRQSEMLVICVYLHLYSEISVQINVSNDVIQSIANNEHNNTIYSMFCDGFVQIECFEIQT